MAGTARTVPAELHTIIPGQQSHVSLCHIRRGNGGFRRGETQPTRIRDQQMLDENHSHRGVAEIATDRSPTEAHQNIVTTGSDFRENEPATIPNSLFLIMVPGTCNIRRFASGRESFECNTAAGRECCCGEDFVTS
jgi:hypothetical protein